MNLIYMTTSLDGILFAASAQTPSGARAILDREGAALPLPMRQSMKTPVIIKHPWASPEDGRMIIRHLRKHLELDDAIATIPIAHGEEFVMSWLKPHKLDPSASEMRQWILGATAHLPHAPRAR